MKKKMVIIFIFLLSGIIVGNNLYKKVDLKLIQTFSESNEFYLLQEGIYSNKDSMQKDTRDISPKIYEVKDDKYYVYVGITSKIENANKIKDIYIKDGININIKKIKIKDEEFINSINQFDILIENTDNKEEILTIEEVVLSSYERKILN